MNLGPGVVSGVASAHVIRIAADGVERYAIAMQTTATYDSGSNIITLTRGAWSQTFSASDLARQIAFYRGQQERFPDHASSYDDDVKALTALAVQLRS